jgi:hypothetical protein
LRHVDCRPFLGILAVRAQRGRRCSFLLQFFVLPGGRVEVAMRVGTTQVFNPKSVRKISAEEISTMQGPKR